MCAHTTNDTPHIILFLDEDALSPRAALCLATIELQTVCILVVHFLLAVHAHMQFGPCLLYAGVPTGSAAVNIGGEGCHCCSLESDQN